MIKLGILGSTKGSDVPPIADAIIAGELDASIEIIITNNKDALIADKALKYLNTTLCSTRRLFCSYK